jgi:hypothetical protein
MFYPRLSAFIRGQEVFDPFNCLHQLLKRIRDTEPQVTLPELPEGRPTQTRYAGFF